MKDIVLKVENVSKQYRLGLVGTGTLTHDINRWWHQIRGKENPYLKIGEANDRSTKGTSDYVWALKDINFEVERGEVLGIIGKNGAGKSTLLKLLSKVTAPTTGSIKYNGKIASLLEVGTGFHPDLTGRENIYLNGAILGMTKKEITAQMDAIIDFSGVERYIDTPVKRYSSGMYVRLAFAVAAHLESDILIVDEVLSVGDAEFQKKCMGKMNDISKGQGRTVLFVSHNMAAVKSLCSKALFIDEGKVKMTGFVNDVASAYQSLGLYNKQNKFVWNENFTPSNENVKILCISLLNDTGKPVGDLTTDDGFRISIQYQIKNITKLGVTFIVSDENDTVIFCSVNNHEKNYYNNTMNVGHYQSYCTVPPYLLNTGNYSVSLIVFGASFSSPIEVKHIIGFEISDGTAVRGDFYGYYAGIIRPFLNWETKKINYEKY